MTGPISRSMVMTTRDPSATGGGSGNGPLTSVTLSASITAPDDTPTEIEWDGFDSGADTNLIAGVPTVPTNNEFWLVWSVLAISAGIAGTVRAVLKGSITGEIDSDEESATSSFGFLATLSGSRRMALVAGETLSVEIHGTTGADVGFGGGGFATYFQFWKVEVAA